MDKKVILRKKKLDFGNAVKRCSRLVTRYWRLPPNCTERGIGFINGLNAAKREQTAGILTFRPNHTINRTNLTMRQSKPLYIPVNFWNGVIPRILNMLFTEQWAFIRTWTARVFKINQVCRPSTGYCNAMI